MKSGMTLQEMAKELERQKTEKRDFVAPASELKMVLDSGNPTGPAHTFNVNGHGAFDINKIAHGQIGSRLGIPAKYYERMRESAPELLTTNVNHWLDGNEDKRMVRTLDGIMRAFLSSRYRPIDNLPIAEVALETLGGLGGLKVESNALTDARMYIKAVTEQITYEIKPGDVVQAGIVISNSEVGMGSVRVEPLIYRLVCTNGMIANDHALRKYHIGRGFDVDSAEELYEDDTRQQSDKAFLMQVRDVIRNSFNKDVFANLATKMLETTKNQITGDPVKVVELTQKKLGLQEAERASVLNHLIRGGDLSQYGLLNAITRASQDVEDYDRATELERMGGAVLELPKTQWKELATAA